MEPKQFRFLLLVPVIGGIALVVGLWILGADIKDSRVNDTITVTGSIKKSVVADLGKWQGIVTQNANVVDGDLTNVDLTMKKVASMSDKVKKFVLSQGIDAAGVSIRPIDTTPIYEQLPNYGQSQKIIGYAVHQEVDVQSTNVNAIEKFSQDASQLVTQGIVFTSQNTEYYYSKLAEVRADLFAQATKDALDRAQAIASGTGVKVGQLRSARTGVVQVLRPNSTDISDYGNYDLSTKEKEISATVSASFALEQ